MAQLVLALGGQLQIVAGRRLAAHSTRSHARSSILYHVRAQGDAGTSGNYAVGEAFPTRGDVKGAGKGKNQGGGQKKASAGPGEAAEKKARAKASSARTNKEQQKKQPPAVEQAPSLIAHFGNDPPGHKSGYVAIVGKPNAGKSTLLNALVGQKLAIVTPKAQTTRHRIIGIMSGDNFQAIFMDTPGIMATSRNKLDTAMMKNVKTALNQGDVLLAIVDSAAALTLEKPEDGLEGLRSAATSGGPQLCVVLNKADLVDDEGRKRLEEAYRKLPGVDQVMFTSAKEGGGVQDLADWVVSRLPMGPTLYPKDQVSEHPERFFVAEIVREHIFEMYQKEVPYCTTVRVLKHSERPGMKDVIKLRISVERETQKGILIGAGGAALKALMTASRKAVESFLEREVYMECEVVVDEDWRENDALVDSFGIAEASTIF